MNWHTANRRRQRASRTIKRPPSPIRHIVDAFMPYPRAAALVAEMERAGVMAGIVPGGIGFWPRGKKETETMRAVCRRFNVTASRGLTYHEAEVIYSR